MLAAFCVSEGMGLMCCRGERYFEVDVDISSSYAASGVVNIVKGATKSMVIDFGVLIEGQVRIMTI
jgi:Protein ENHANCED DISEASE RESISTANCE 2, C-terminal